MSSDIRTLAYGVPSNSENSRMLSASDLQYQIEQEKERRRQHPHVHRLSLPTTALRRAKPTV